MNHILNVSIILKCVPSNACKWLKHENQMTQWWYTAVPTLYTSSMTYFTCSLYGVKIKDSLFTVLTEHKLKAIALYYFDWTQTKSREIIFQTVTYNMLPIHYNGNCTYHMFRHLLWGFTAMRTKWTQDILHCIYLMYVSFYYICLS